MADGGNTNNFTPTIEYYARLDRINAQRRQRAKRASDNYWLNNHLVNAQRRQRGRQCEPALCYLVPGNNQQNDKE